MYPPEDTPGVAPAAPPPGEWQPDRPEYAAFARFATLTKEKRALTDRLKQIESALDVLEYQLRDFLGVGGYDKVSVEGFTIFLRRQLYVRAREGVSAAQVCAALKRHGMAQFVKEQYNVSTLSKHVRELESEYADQLRSGDLASIADVLPAGLAQVLNLDPTYSVIALETGK